MKTLWAVSALLETGIVSGSASAAVVIDELNGTSLNPMWTLHDSPSNHSSGGVTHPDGYLVFSNLYTNAYGHIDTSVNTTNGVRVDAITRADGGPITNWGIGTTIYFDANNWVSMRQTQAGGQNGYTAYIMSNGNYSGLVTNDHAVPLGWWLSLGVELTATQIKFYGSPLVGIGDHFGETNIDANTIPFPELTMTRPANFTGNATVIIGKGYTNVGAGYSNTFFDNNSETLGDAAVAGIDYVRIITDTVPEPTGFGLIAVSLSGLFHRRR